MCCNFGGCVWRITEFARISNSPHTPSKRRRHSTRYAVTGQTTHLDGVGHAIRRGTGMILVLRPIRVLRLRRSRTGRSTFAGITGLPSVAFGAPHLVQDGRFRAYRHGVAAKMWTKGVCPAATPPIAISASSCLLPNVSSSPTTVAFCPPA